MITVEIALYQGISQFGRAYRIMLENDTHAPESVDRALMERMIRLCPETAGYLYEAYTPVHVGYRQDARPELEGYVAKATTASHTDEERIEGIVGFCAALCKLVEDETLDEMRVGGIEEEIISRGSDWCTDLARVGCALCQVAGFPARLAAMFDTTRAYSGHEIIEVYRGGRWGAADPTYGTVYRDARGNPLSVWELAHAPNVVKAHWSGDRDVSVRMRQFENAAIVNYFVWECREYDYTVGTVNSYYRSILSMSLQGWPGGLRWLHGEDVS